MYISVELLSETIFGSGYSVPGSVDLEIVHDEFGLPYFRGKTLKGKLREECENIVSFIKNESIKNEYEEAIIKIFGKADNDNYNLVKFSDLKVNNNIMSYINYGLKSLKPLFSKEEVLDALTSKRYFTKLDENGIAEKGTLRQFRVINAGLTFQCDLTLERKLTPAEIQLLCCGIKSLKHLGTLENRGKGLVKASLIDNGKDICEENINDFMERVSG